MDIQELIPYTLTFGFAVMIVAVIALVLTGFQTSSSVTTAGLNSGGGSAHGIFIQANSVIAGNIVANGLSGGSTGGGSGGGAIVIFANTLGAYSYTAGTYQTSAGAGSGAGGAGQSFVSLYLSNTPVIPYNAGSGTACVANQASGQCSGTIDYNLNTVLTGNVNASTNIVIEGGITLWSNGYSILAGNMLYNKGTINTNTIGNGGGASSGVGGAGVSFTSSFGGSGGGGQGCVYAGGAGGSTNGIAGGAGGTGGSSTCTAGSAGSNAIPPTTGSVTANINEFQVFATNTAGFAQGTYLSSGSGGGAGGVATTAYNAIGNGLTATSNIANQFGLLGTVIGLGLVLGVVLSIFGFGRGKPNDVL